MSISCHATGCCFGQYNLERGCLVISVLGIIFGTASLVYWCVAVSWIQIITCAFFTMSSGVLFYGVIQKAAIFCLPWLAWVGPEVLAVIDIIITIAATVFVDSQDENSTPKKWEMQDARYWLWAGFGISVIISLVVFGLTLYFGNIVYSHYCELKDIPQVRVRSPEEDKDKKKPNKSSPPNSVRIGRVVTPLPESVENRDQ